MGRVQYADDLVSQSGAPMLPRTEQALAAVAGQQRGLVTRVQCRAAFLTPKAIESRLRVGRWLPVHRNIYQTLPGRDDGWTTALAGQLACGDGAAWSHRTAALAWGLVRAGTGAEVDILIPHSRRIASPFGVVLHRSDHEAVRVDDRLWPWRTTVVDTVLDVGALTDEDGQLAVLASAFQRRLVTEAQVRAGLDRRHAHPWRELLSTVLAVTADGAESPLEVRYARDVEGAHRLPVGTRQHATVPGRRAHHDVAYPAYRLVVELDGRLGHDGWAARVADGVRDRGSAASGWLTTRARWGDVTLRRCALADEIGAILSSRGWGGAPQPCRRPSCMLRAA